MAAGQWGSMPNCTFLHAYCHATLPYVIPATPGPNPRALPCDIIGRGGMHRAQGKCIKCSESQAVYLLCCASKGRLRLGLARGHKRSIQVVQFYNLFSGHSMTEGVTSPAVNAQDTAQLRQRWLLLAHSGGGRTARETRDQQRTSMPQTSRVESAWANAKPLLIKYFVISPGAVVTSSTPGFSSEMVGT